MILDENLFEKEKELPKKQPRYFAKEVNGKGYVYDRKFSSKVPSNVDKDIATAKASVKRWNKEEPITEGKNLDDIVYDKLSRIKLSKGKDGKPRHPEVYANPKGNGFKLELDDEVGIDQAIKIAKEHGLNHNVKKVRDYIEFTVDMPERKVFTETYSKSSLEQEIRNKVRDTFPNFADEEYAEYIGDYLVVEIVPQDGRTKVEVRADLTYKMMDKIADNLNPIVQKLDKDAYFDHEDTGIINAFINSKDLKESVHKTKLAEWVSSFRKKSTESVKESFEDEHLGTSTEETPEPGPEAGIASLVNKLIIDEWEAIQGYNDAIVAAETEGYSDIANVLRDIANEENLHVGQLEQVMQQLSPNAESINQGEVEADEQLSTTTETSEDPEEGMHY